MQQQQEQIPINELLIANRNASAISQCSKRIVHVRVLFLKIGEIDTVKELYGADIYVQARWQEPLLDNKRPDELKSIDCKSLWNPRLYIDNEMTDKRSLITYRVTLNEQGEAYVSEWRKIRGDFYESLELDHFPLDIQDLSIVVASERPQSDVDLVMDHENLPRINVVNFVDAQEWFLYQHVSVTKKTEEEIARDSKHSTIRFTCQAGRRAGFFAYNIFLIMFFITSLAFGTFAVECYLPQNRLQLTFTLVLTAVAFKIAIGSTLPKVSYLTFADKYVVLSLFFLVIICAWHAIVAVEPELCYKSPNNPASFYQWKVEQWVILGFFGIYLLGHIVFAALFYVRIWEKRTETAKKDHEFRKNNFIQYREI